jgi:hypothetical protein
MTGSRRVLGRRPFPPDLPHNLGHQVSASTHHLALKGPLSVRQQSALSA